MIEGKHMFFFEIFPIFFLGLFSFTFWIRFSHKVPNRLASCRRTVTS